MLESPRDSTDAHRPPHARDRHREFRALWASSTASSIALWTLLLGNAWIVYKLSNSSLWVGVATFASMSPYFVAPLAGVAADRIERRRLGQAARFAAFVSTAVLFAVALLGAITVWIVVAMAAVQGVLRSVQTAADQAPCQAVCRPRTSATPSP